MQFRSLLLLGLFLGAEASQKEARQELAPRANTPGVPQSTAVGVVPKTSDAAQLTTAADTGGSGTTADSSKPTSDSGSGKDTTITQTTTVTNKNAKTVSTTTTVLKTVTSTILVTSTTFSTTTITKSDAATATKTVFTTTTKLKNKRRAIDLAPRTIEPEERRAAPKPTQFEDLDEELDEQDLNLIRHKRNLAKRGTVTKTVTVTVGDSNAKTITKSVSRTVISTVKKSTKTTSVITQTDQKNAKTTVTTTSTLTVYSTAVTTGAAKTEAAAPSGSYSAVTGGGSSNKGLSTGAKAGIGAGCGIAGLIILAGLAWFCVKRRNQGPKVDEDDLFGSSEVPVGSSGGGHGSSPMSQTTAAAAASHLGVTRNPTKPSVQEGYRGTALSDGRTGFAKPQQFGAAYSAPAKSVSPDMYHARTTPDTLPEHPAPDYGDYGEEAQWHHPHAAEIDSQQVRGPHGSSPPPQVYEMSGQAFR